MKKKLIALVTVFVLVAGILSGCGARFSKIKIRNDFVQSYDYVVRSNGGSAVQYGDYIYFINGSRGYDNDGTQNAWSNDTSVGHKGGLYKAKLLGNTKGREFEIVRDAGTGLQFVSSSGVKYEDEVNEELAEGDREIIDVVDVQLISSKIIGTSGYEGGGIYIYDDFVYYASPNNSLNKGGTVQVEKTDFYRTKLDGTLTQLIFTTEGAAASQPYNFYKQGDKVYLVCFYESSIISVAMQDGKKKIGNPMLLTDEATGVMFAHKDVYDSQNNITNSPEDFVFFTRNIDSDDSVRSGNVIEACRPDGSENFTVLANGKTVTMEAVRGGGLFYRTTEGSNDVIKFDNMHESLMQFSPTYKAYEESKTEGAVDAANRRRSQISETVFVGVGSYTSLYCFKDSLFANQAYILATASNAVFLLSNYSENIRVLPTSGTVLYLEGNMMYYKDSENKVYRTTFNVAASEKTDEDYELLTPETPILGTYPPDLVAGNLFYYANVDEWAASYGYFIEVNRPGAEGKEVYMRAESDFKPEEEEEEVVEEEV